MSNSDTKSTSGCRAQSKAHSFVP